MSPYSTRFGNSSALLISVLVIPAALHWAAAQTNSPEALPQRVKNLEESLSLTAEQLDKHINELLWRQRLGDLAEIDLVRYTGPAPRVIQTPAAPGASNQIIVTAYTFMPKRFMRQKLPLLVLVHGEVHGDFKPDQAHLVRELMAQGYAVIAPDYRGSTGYGRDYWRLIDYGGLENDDVLAAKRWMVENHPNLDRARVGIMGWSHGGMIALMNIFDHPQDYQAAYAGMPVSDLIMRMGYKDQGYRDLFSAPYHLGKSAADDAAEYQRRSPAWNAAKLQRPVLIHAATNDEDVSLEEVEQLIKALKAAGKDFQYKVYTNAPGGHAFSLLDTKPAQQSRQEIYRFLARHLKPPKPPR